MSSPEAQISQFSSICSVGWRPLLITGFLLDWLRRHFSATGNIEDEDLSNTLWKADNTTNILIESITRWKPELTAQRPALIVKRNAVSVDRQGIDDKLMGYQPVNGEQFYATLLKGSHTIFCIGKEGAELEKLSTEVYRELLEFGPPIRKTLNLHKFLLNSVGDIFRIEEDRESFAIPVTLSYVFEDVWKIKPRGTLVKRIDLALFQP